MEPQIFSLSDNKTSEDPGRFPNLASCAKTWDRYQASSGFNKSIVASLYDLLNKESRLERNEAKYYHHDEQVGTNINETAPEAGGPSNSRYERVGQLNSNLLFKPNSSLLLPSTNVSNNDTDGDYQLEALEGRWQIYLATLYTLTAVASFILNIITVIVLARCRKSELTKYLINLSVSDLLMSMFSIRK